MRDPTKRERERARKRSAFRKRNPRFSSERSSREKSMFRDETAVRVSRKRSVTMITITALYPKTSGRGQLPNGWILFDLAWPRRIDPGEYVSVLGDFQLYIDHGQLPKWESSCVSWWNRGTDFEREKDPRRVMGPRGDSTRKEVLVSLPKFHMVASCLHTFMTIFDLAKITNDQFSAPNGVNITNDRFLLRMASWFLILWPSLILWNITNDRFLLRMVSWFLILWPFPILRILWPLQQVVWPMFKEIVNACLRHVPTIWNRECLFTKSYEVNLCTVWVHTVLTVIFDTSRFDTIHIFFWQDYIDPIIFFVKIHPWSNSHFETYPEIWRTGTVCDSSQFQILSFCDWI